MPILTGGFEGRQRGADHLFYKGTITVDNNAYSNDAADPSNIILDQRTFATLGVQVHNSGAANGADYEILGHFDYDGGTPPSLETGGWHRVTAADATVGAGGTAATQVTWYWSWVALRLKRATAGASTTASYFMRGVY